MSPIQDFLAATDRHGAQLYADAMVIAEHEEHAVIDWRAFDACGHATHRRTAVGALGQLVPGVMGDEEHVHAWLVRQVKRNLSGVFFHA